MIYTCPSGGCQACRKLFRHGLLMSVLDFPRFFFYLNDSLYILTKFLLKTSFFHCLFVMMYQNRSSVISWNSPILKPEQFYIISKLKLLDAKRMDLLSIWSTLVIFSAFIDFSVDMSPLYFHILVL